MENSTYISFIIPCYNGESFIERAILSILRQPISGFEIIVINDGSTDRTGEICESYKDKIKYYSTENLGTGHARNFGIEKSIGKWIVFVDADDLLLSNAFSQETILELQALEAKSIDVIYTPFITSDFMIKESVRKKNSEQYDKIEHIPQHEFWTCIYRKEYLKKHNITFYEYREQDIATAFRYLVFSKKPNVITKNDFCFYLQRDNKSSNTHTWKLQTLYYVKSQVYYDLYINHSNEKSQNWLYENVIELMHQYFWSVFHAKYSVKYEYDSMKLLLKKVNNRKHINKNIKRHFHTNKILAFITFFLPKMQMHEVKEKNKIQYPNNSCELDILFHRLQILSEMVRAM